MVLVNSVFTNVVFPTPDSPFVKKKIKNKIKALLVYATTLKRKNFLPQTIIVKFAPFFATILCLWLGKLAIPVPDKAVVKIGGEIEISSKSIMFRGKEIQKIKENNRFFLLFTKKKGGGS